MERSFEMLEPLDASACLIVCDSEKLLFQKRDNKEGIFFPKRWGLFGGAIDFGESPRDCIVREIKEEIDLEIAPSRFDFLSELCMKSDSKRLSRYFFKVRISEHEFDSITLKEGSRHGAFAFCELNDLSVTPYDEYFLQIFYNTAFLRG